ncbi:bifunctional serine/threonine-protein kinase/ABC transporter substrate-binding protein [Nocardia altamirensis]|uniref:bifunctional serine/threonine-protein kinase/ABC transporter substrate-binding protein n=1 Tax=Nocardia altamirensis TaxID=472158 RepID=UPI000A535F5A|nr:bifunctional serine/threonine-protein kinase/ABC transporter substrate-binding protein [Nocardia altamirensis]
MLRAGEVFAGYVIERRLGRGGMGSVYLARHPRLPRRIALKLLSTNLHADKEMQARFEREAELVARLDHPNIVAVYDRGVDEDVRWISMQYVDGVDAGALDPQSLAPERAVEIIAETAKALDYAHAVGVLHRDVKPANILLAHATAGQGERVLLTDFGIARLRDESRQLTRTGTFTATLAYAAPEQLSATTVDHRTDQYALACSLFWLLTGTAPFEADSPAATIAGHLQQPPPSVRDRRTGLPAALDAVLAKALAKRLDERFESCTEFATAAREALAATADSVAVTRSLSEDSVAHPVSAPTVPQSWAPPRTPSAGTGEPATATLVARRPTARYLGVGVAALVVVALVAGVVWVIGRSGPDKPPTDASRTIVWSGAIAPGTASAPRALAPLAQLDAQGRELTSSTTAATPTGDGKATCKPVTIATTAGPEAGVGGGAQLAVDEFTKANPGCPVALKKFDIDPSTAANVATQIANDPSIVALIGPVFSPEIQAVGTVLDGAGLPFLTPSATDPTLSGNGWRTFFRGLAADDVQGTALGKYLASTSRNVCVLRDRSGYGKSVAGNVVAALGFVTDPRCAALDIAKGDRDFATVVATVTAADPDTVFFSGFYEEGAALLEQLRRAGVRARFVSAETTLTPDFIAQAGNASSGAIVACSCGPVVSQFANDYRTRTGQAPGPGAVEAYDLTTIILKGIAAGRTTRAGLAEYLRGYDDPGLARTYRWTATGDLVNPQTWLYQVN